MLPESFSDFGGVAGGRHDRMASGQGGFGQVDAHATGGTGDEPDLVGHDDAFLRYGRRSVQPAHYWSQAGSDRDSAALPGGALTGPPPVLGPRMFDPVDTNDLGEFLISRRAKLSLQQAGLPDFGGRRRVPGLREEVALLAGMSAEYYKRLERGNAKGVSDAVIDGVSRALQLDAAEHAHLCDLVRAANAGTPRRGRPTRRRA